MRSYLSTSIVCAFLIVLTSPIRTLADDSVLRPVSEIELLTWETDKPRFFQFCLDFSEEDSEEDCEEAVDDISNSIARDPEIWLFEPPILEIDFENWQEDSNGQPLTSAQQ